MSESPLSRRVGKCTGTRAEKRTAKRLGAKLTPASGGLDGAKGDMALPSFLIENKSTVNASMSLKLDWLLKIKQEALERGLTPAVTLQFTSGNGQPLDGGSYVIIEEQVFREICEDNKN